MTPISDEAVWAVCAQVTSAAGSCKKCCASPVRHIDGMGTMLVEPDCLYDARRAIERVLRAVSENPTAGSEK